MSWRMLLLPISAAAVVAATFFPTEASAYRRGRSVMDAEAYDRSCGRLPAYGFDGCGKREFSYGPGSCWRRAIVSTQDGPEPRRVWNCGRTG